MQRVQRIVWFARLLACLLGKVWYVVPTIIVGGWMSRHRVDNLFAGKVTYLGKIDFFPVPFPRGQQVALHWSTRAR